jgi:hypothetical protein
VSLRGADAVGDAAILLNKGSIGVPLSGKIAAHASRARNDILFFVIPAKTGIHCQEIRQMLQYMTCVKAVDLRLRGDDDLLRKSF